MKIIRNEFWKLYTDSLTWNVVYKITMETTVYASQYNVQHMNSSLHFTFYYHHPIMFLHNISNNIKPIVLKIFLKKTNKRHCEAEMYFNYYFTERCLEAQTNWVLSNRAEPGLLFPIWQANKNVLQKNDTITKWRQNIKMVWIKSIIMIYNSYLYHPLQVY